MAEAGKLNRPDDSHRITIVGATGTGKTVAGVWHLSRASFTRRPWIIFDFKRDEKFLGKLGAQELKITGRPPRDPGLYITRPLPGEEADIDDFLWRVHRNGNTGLYVDEGYRMPRFPAFSAYRTILTQGRSLRLPVINLSQRPSWMDNFVFTESNFWQVFRLQHADDRAKVEGFVSPDAVRKHWLTMRLPKFNSWWYDVDANLLRHWGPVPKERDIIASIRARLGRTVFV